MVKVIIKNSTNKNKKLMAVFEYDDGKKKTIHFGQAGASDFTKNKDEKRKSAYLARHSKNENWNNYDTAGALSRWILWNKTSLSASIANYKSKFSLK
tara:strand:- start:1718 stop:2008 length:291 start_codon:yes stop_codon:yes gene_type:complete